MRQETSVPTHVPAHLIIDFDIYRPFDRDPSCSPGDYHEPFARLQRKAVPPIFWSPHNGGHWVVTRQRLLSQIFADHRNFPSDYVVVPKERRAPAGFRQLPIQANPPEHAAYRALFASAFTQPAIKRREADVRSLARSLIGELAPKGRCDFARDFAKHLPIRVFLGMVGIPETDRLKLTDIAERIFRATGEPRTSAFRELGEYLGREIDGRSEGHGADLISKIINSNVGDSRVSRKDAIGVLSVLMAAGLDTVASMSSFIMRFLAINPAHRRALTRDPALIPAATEEFLRRFALLNAGRVVAKDITVNDVLMKEGDMVMLPTTFGAFDSEAYEDPASVNFQRKSPQSLTFGHGIHGCPGNMLARMEIRVTLEEWLPRIPEFELDPQSPPIVHTGTSGTITSLCLVWPT